MNRSRRLLIQSWSVSCFFFYGVLVRGAFGRCLEFSPPPSMLPLSNILSGLLERVVYPLQFCVFHDAVYRL